MLRNWWGKQFKPLSPVSLDWESACVQICDLHSWFLNDLKKSYVVFQKTLKSAQKMVAIFCMNPVILVSYITLAIGKIVVGLLETT